MCSHTYEMNTFISFRMRTRTASATGKKGGQNRDKIGKTERARDKDR